MLCKTKTCKMCKGTGKIPTYAKRRIFMGIDISGSKFTPCPSCWGKGVK